VRAAASALIVLATVAASRTNAAVVDVSNLPPAATNVIIFDQHVRPIFEQSCFRCHGPERPKSNYRLDTREAALKGGDNGIAIIPAKSAESPLIHYVAGLNEEMLMPPKGKGEPLTAEEVALLRAWIDQGVPWSAETVATSSYVSVSPTVRWISVTGNNSTFREQTWQREGFTAGLENFEVREAIDPRTRVIATGRALRDEFRVALSLERADVGFIHAGAEEFHRFSSDAGGFYPGFSPSVSALDRDLRLDIGRAWFDLGLTLPDLPRLVVGYEYQYREGEKSTLQWNDVTQGSATRKIAPSSKRIDEDVHIIKVDISHTLAGFYFEDRFRGEFYDLGTSRRSGASTSTAHQEVREGQSWFHGANTFRVEKPFNDWLSASAGYLFSSLNSDAAIRQMNTEPLAAIRTRGDRIVVDRDSHVANLSGLVGPWHALSLSAGVQAEWMRQKSFGGGVETILFPDGSSLPDYFPDFKTDIDRATLEETARLRYTGLPFTTLFAEGRLQQESVGQYEESCGQGASGIDDFLRDTDASSDVREWRAGFSTSPWTRATLTAHFRQFQRLASYEDLLDIIPPGNTPNFGYSAFIRSRDVLTDEVDARLNLRATRWLKVTLGYKYLVTDYWTETDAAAVASLGGWIPAADQESHVYTAGLTLTPWRRLYWNTALAWHDTHTVAKDNGSLTIAPYRGNIYSVLSSATYALTERMDLQGSYTFSTADYAQNNFAAGLPLGLEYQRHGIEVAVSRRWLNTVSTRLQYGFYKYDEPSRGHLTDYTAHAIFATLTARWP
jgi:hypothetical protein